MFSYYIKADQTYFGRDCDVVSQNQRLDFLAFMTKKGKTEKGNKISSQIVSRKVEIVNVDMNSADTDDDTFTNGVDRNDQVNQVVYLFILRSPSFNHQRFLFFSLFDLDCEKKETDRWVF